MDPDSFYDQFGQDEDNSALLLAIQGMKNAGQIGGINAQGAQLRENLPFQTASQEALQGQQISGQEALAGIQGGYNLAGEQTAASAGEQEAQTAAQASELPYTLRASEFNQLYPMFQQQSQAVINSAGPGAMSGKASTSGQPTINAGPVWTPTQVQQQQNQSAAQTDQQTATQQKLNTQKTAGQGYSSNSPLLADLNQSAQMAGNATKSANKTAIGWNSAQGNAQQLLSGQTAQEGQYASRQNEALQRQSTLLNYLNGLNQSEASSMVS